VRGYGVSLHHGHEFHLPAEAALLPGVL
jgi:hypothetical protein